MSFTLFIAMSVANFVHARCLSHLREVKESADDIDPASFAEINIFPSHRFHGIRTSQRSNSSS